MIGLFYDGLVSFLNGQLEVWIEVFKNSLLENSKSQKQIKPFEIH
jgi:hypothetical protein